MFQTSYDAVLGRLIQPIRFTGIISFLLWFQKSNVQWDPSLMFFYYFIPLYVASYAIEVILTSALKGMRAGLNSLSIKFMQLLPVELAGVCGFALLSFAPRTNEMFLLTIRLEGVIIACWLGIELYHKYLVPRLNKIRLTFQMKVLTVVGMTVTLFFYGMYAVFTLSVQHSFSFL